MLLIVLVVCVSLCSCPCCDVRVDFHIKLCSVRLYHQMFVGGLIFIVFFYEFCVMWGPTFCPIGCLYGLGSVVLCPLRSPHKTTFGWSLPRVVCRKAHVLFTLYVFVCVQRCPTHIVLCFLLFVFTSSYLQEGLFHVLFILFVLICTA
jgi:hypothetical protein